ncbi:MAG: septum formation protein Maf [Rhodospirillaceae bacterium]|nr:septum formation protein Maf [Rhodospirillaceae bacterium]MBT3787663.1 septum formation protein Maf [Alphaproteobacteria bacterium]MBT4084970.1 septum formation protein Maf [Alphaproteobacteria bacterium]MBT4545518.1 septum formation protein Maf [Alphaproteobacteria bacterium]MBT6386427.1 septum formation protein Maf [Alphaproteobacteria bacterium]
MRPAVAGNKTPGNSGAPPVILASGSTVRARLLKNAGLNFTVEVSAVDEDSIKQNMQADAAPAHEIAAALAEQKAQRVSRNHPEAYVIGADQILGLGDDGDTKIQMFDKPVGMAGARNHLQRLRGHEHRLFTAACICRNGQPVWQHLETPRLTMRDFSDAFLEDYLAQSGEKILNSVGAYLLEDRGAQLFSKIDGDYFSILGLPLLSLLAFLREHGIVDA